MDKSPDRPTGKVPPPASHRYKAFGAMALAAAAVAFSVYLRTTTMTASAPVAATASTAKSAQSADCVRETQNVAALSGRSGCRPMPAIAAAAPTPSEPAFAASTRNRESARVRPRPALAAASYQSSAPENEVPRVGYTIAELCSAGPADDSQLYCQTDSARDAVRNRRHNRDDSEFETYSISGHVITAEGRGLGGVTVMASPERLNGWEKTASSETLRFLTLTDSLGAYAFDGLPEGDYSIRVSRQPPYRGARTIARTGIDYADLMVKRDSELTIAGQVIASDGQPLEGVTVLPVLLGQASVISDESGHFELPVSLDTNVNAVKLRFQRPGYVEESATALLKSVSAADAKIIQRNEIRQVMEPVESWTSLRGTVQNNAGKALIGRAVELRPLHANRTYRTSTDREGQFEFPMLEAPADYRLLVFGGGGYKDFQQSLTLTANNSELPIIIDAYEFGKVTGQLVNSSGEPLADIDLVLRNTDSLKPNTVVRTDKDGYFEVESAPAGDFVLASQSNPAMLVKGLHLEPGEALHLPLLLDWGRHEIHGSVVDAMNNPVPASRVVLQWSLEADGVTTNATRRAAADAQGHFAFSNLGPGPHLLRVDAPGHGTVAINHDLTRQGYEVTVRMN